MKKSLLLLVTVLSMSFPTFASTWEYAYDFDDITQEKEYYAIASSDSAKDLLGKKIKEEAQLVFYRSGKLDFIMVYIDKGTLDICIDGCRMPLRIDNKSYDAYLAGSGGEANAITRVISSTPYESHLGYEFLSKELGNAKSVSFRTSKFIGETTNFYFTFDEPVDLSIFDEN